ncbi:Hypothetical_protein [Hexamita inflata]|uniref:Hypothetical_protein n=1 Tax=Hexamita inflata TaxID=28002 RepID=A0AA86PNP0_9EUKA|nr:Hypothetical protein HINF_LOCUS31009 [Hexamita inflata]
MFNSQLHSKTVHLEDDVKALKKHIQKLEKDLHHHEDFKKQLCIMMNVKSYSISLTELLPIIQCGLTNKTLTTLKKPLPAEEYVAQLERKIIELKNFTTTLNEELNELRNADNSDVIAKHKLQQSANSAIKLSTIKDRSIKQLQQEIQELKCQLDQQIHLNKLLKQHSQTNSKASTPMMRSMVVRELDEEEEFTKKFL